MNCKPGDLAITTYSRIPGNDGRIVEVVRPYVAKFDDGNGPRWWIKSSGTAMDSKEGSTVEGHSPDRCLRPLPGLPDTEDADTEQPIKEVA